MPTSIGFTGTRDGATDSQRFAIRHRFDRLKPRPSTAHHGCCVGADEDFVTICAGIVYVIGHPPIDDKLLSTYACGLSDEVMRFKGYLERNRDIVDETEELWAAPKGSYEELRSGTWSTVRYARSLGKLVVIFWPDGRVEELPGKQH